MNTHILTCNRISFFLRLNSISLHICIIFHCMYVHKTAFIHCWWIFELFLPFGYCNNDAMNISVQISIWAFAYYSFVHMPRRENAESHSNFLRKCYTAFHRGLPLYNSNSNAQVLQLLHILNIYCFLFFLFFNSHSKWVWLAFT